MFVVGANLPLNIVDYQHFTKFVQGYLQPMYVGISRKILLSNCIDYFFRHQKYMIHDLQDIIVLHCLHLIYGKILIKKKRLYRCKCTLYRPTFGYV